MGRPPPLNSPATPPPALRFARVEAAGGIVLLAAAVMAMIWANSLWHESYESFVSTPVDLRLGTSELTIQEIVNDVLMTFFFLVAGLEIKRQLVAGELRDRRSAALPAIAALGGIVVPAVIYLAFNAGQPGARGWGIPIATDIAFALGIVALVGSRLPVGVRVLMLTLAVVDDVGGIVIIAVFYADNVALPWLGLAAAAVAATVVVRRVAVRSLLPYVVFGAVCWYGLYQAGVEAAIAGVIFGLLAPIQPSVERIEHTLNLWVSFLIVPLFAIINAGVRLDSSSVDERVLLGTAVGLVVGKTVGVFGAAWLGLRLGVGRLPIGTTGRHLFGLAVTAGIGFTVALFITGLSFTDPGLIASAKLGILGGSVVAGALGFAILRFAGPVHRR